MKRACERGYEQGHRSRPQPHSRTACRRQPRPSGMNTGAARARRRALRPLRLIIVRAALGATCNFMTGQRGQQQASPGKLQHEYQRTQPQYNAQPLSPPRDPGTVSASSRRTASVNRLHYIDSERLAPRCQIGAGVRPGYEAFLRASARFATPRPMKGIRRPARGPCLIRFPSGARGRAPRSGGPAARRLGSARPARPAPARSAQARC